jgi:hypothetical protein
MVQEKKKRGGKGDREKGGKGKGGPAYGRLTCEVALRAAAVSSTSISLYSKSNFKKGSSQPAEVYRKVNSRLSISGMRPVDCVLISML